MDRKTNTALTRATCDIDSGQQLVEGQAWDERDNTARPQVPILRDKRTARTLGL
jgi:hypothetical protein